MTEPTRFEIDGARHYTTDIPGKAYPSVTTILGKTASEHAKKMLNNWNLKNPGGKEKAAARGTAIHQACEDYIRGLPINLPDEYLPFWRGLSQHLDKYDYFVWSEKPLRPEWNYCTGKDGISRVWSHKYHFCGCPDLIGVRGGVVILADFQNFESTVLSILPYQTRQEQLHRLEQAQQVWDAARCLRPGCRRDIGTGGSLRPDPRLTPEIDQSFILHGDELSRFQTKWLQKVRRYEELKELEHQEQLEKEEEAQ